MLYTTSAQINQLPTCQVNNTLTALIISEKELQAESINYQGNIIQSKLNDMPMKICRSDS